MHGGGKGGEEREAEEEGEGEVGGGHFLNDQTNKTLGLV